MPECKEKISYLRCSKCKEAIVEQTKYMDWLSIFNFFQFLYHEEYIEESTYVSMIDKLQTFKDFCFSEEENADEV